MRERAPGIETLPEARKLVDGVLDGLREAGVKARGEVVNAASTKVGPAIEEAAEAFGADLVAVGGLERPVRPGGRLHGKRQPPLKLK